MGVYLSVIEEQFLSKSQQQLSVEIIDQIFEFAMIFLYSQLELNLDSSIFSMDFKDLQLWKYAEKRDRYEKEMKTLETREISSQQFCRDYRELAVPIHGMIIGIIKLYSTLVYHFYKYTGTNSRGPHFQRFVDANSDRGHETRTAEASLRAERVT